MRAIVLCSLVFLLCHILNAMDSHCFNCAEQITDAVLFVDESKEMVNLNMFYFQAEAET